MLAAVVRKLVVGKDRAGNDVGPRMPSGLRLAAAAGDAEGGVVRCFFGSPSALARDDVAAYHSDQWCLGAWIRIAMELLGVGQQLVSVGTSMLLTPRPKPRLDLPGAASCCRPDRGTWRTICSWRDRVPAR